MISPRLKIGYRAHAVILAHAVIPAHAVMSFPELPVQLFRATVRSIRALVRKASPLAFPV